MCTPNGIVVLSDAIKNVVSISSQVTEYNENQKISSLKQQAAIYDIQQKENQAKKLQQEGIEAKREKRIEALNALSSEVAKNASSGFDLSSQSLNYRFEDIYNLGEYEADKIEQKYQNQAQNYIDSANTARINLNIYQKTQEKNNILNKLGMTSKVANNWFDLAQKEEYVHF